MFYLQNPFRRFRRDKHCAFDPVFNIVESYVRQAQSRGIQEMSVVLQDHVPPRPLQIVASDESNKSRTFDVSCTRTLTISYNVQDELIEKSRIEGFEENSLNLQDQILNYFKQFQFAENTGLQITDFLESDKRTLLIKIPTET